MLKYTNCNLCKNDKTKILFSLGWSNLVQCKKCGLTYKNPRPSEEDLLRHFSYRRIEERNRITQCDSKIKLFKKNLKRIEKYSPKGKLLDLGCGYGTFLKMAEENGWEAQGVEISELAYKHVKEKLGLNIFKGTLKEAYFPDNYFDVVALWGVLEQLSDPFAELLEINRILKKGGLLLLRMRNATFHLNMHFLFANVANKLGIKPFVFHFYAFSAKTTKAMLRKNGFKDIKIINSELTTGDPSSAGEMFGKFGMRVIKNITFSLCQLIFYLTGGLLVLSPSILAFAKKRVNNSKEDYVKN